MSKGWTRQCAGHYSYVIHKSFSNDMIIHIKKTQQTELNKSRWQVMVNDTAEADHTKMIGSSDTSRGAKLLAREYLTDFLLDYVQKQDEYMVRDIPIISEKDVSNCG